MPKGQFRRFATLDQYPMLKRSGDHCICGVNTYYIVDWTCILLPFMLCSFSKTTLQNTTGALESILPICAVSTFP